MFCIGAVTTFSSSCPSPQPPPAAATTTTTFITSATSPHSSAILHVSAHTTGSDLGSSSASLLLEIFSPGSLVRTPCKVLSRSDTVVLPTTTDTALLLSPPLRGVFSPSGRTLIFNLLLRPSTISGGGGAGGVPGGVVGDGVGDGVGSSTSLTLAYTLTFAPHSNDDSLPRLPSYIDAADPEALSQAAGPTASGAGAPSSSGSSGSSGKNHAPRGFFCGCGTIASATLKNKVVRRGGEAITALAASKVVAARSAGGG
ncbi:hypothetical protein ScalyP_jg7530, partial [Parmales sp. scaly parma]